MKLEPKYSKVKIKILKVSLPTYWYANLIGKIVEVEKQTFETFTDYKSMEEESAYFAADDIEEVQE
jgi:hypothetical protein